MGPAGQNPFAPPDRRPPRSGPPATFCRQKGPSLVRHPGLASRILEPFPLGRRYPWLHASPRTFCPHPQRSVSEAARETVEQSSSSLPFTSSRLGGQLPSSAPSPD